MADIIMDFLEYKGHIWQAVYNYEDKYIFFTHRSLHCCHGKTPYLQRTLSDELRNVEELFNPTVSWVGKSFVTSTSEHQWGGLNIYQFAEKMGYGKAVKLATKW